MNQRMLCCIGLVPAAFLLAGCSGTPPNPNEPKGKPISHWIKKLQSDNAQDRSTALNALWGSGRHAKEAVPALIEVLKTREWADRRGAANVLGQIGAEAKEAVPALVACLKDSNYYVRSDAASALGGIGPDAKEAVPALMEALSETYRVKPKPPPEGKDVKPGPFPDTDLVTGQFREAILDSLARLGPAALVAVLKAEQPAVRDKAADMLRKMDGKKAVPDLVEVLKDAEPGLRRHAVALLAQIGPDAKEAVPTLLKVLKDDDVIMRMHVARTLWLIDKHEAAMPTLLEGLKGADTAIRVAAIHAVAAIGPDAKEAIPVLIGFLGDKNETRDPAIAALVRIGSAAAPALAEVLRHKDRRVQYAAAYAVRELGPAAKEAVPALVDLLKDKQESIRMTAADALGKIGPEAKAAVPALMQAVKFVNFKERSFAAEDIEILAAIEAQLIGAKVAKSTTDWLKGKRDAEAIWGAYRIELNTFGMMRAEAAKALKKIDPEAPRTMVPELIEGLKDKSAVFRYCSATGLGFLGPHARSAVPALIEAFKDNSLKDEDAQNRIGFAVGSALRTTDPQAAVVILLKDLNHPEARVRRLAVYALTHCGPAAKNAVPALMHALQDADPQVREAASRAIGEIDPQAAKKAGAK